MRRYNLSHLADAELLRRLASLVAQHCVTTAVMLAHIAEADARRLYLPLGHSSMHTYCTERLHLSDDAAYKRIQAARAARRHPALFDFVADGRLHLSAVCLIAPHLTPDNFEELVALATHRGKLAIERALAQRFAVDWLPAESGALPSPPLAPGQADPAGLEDRLQGPTGAAAANELAPGQVVAAAPAQTAQPVPSAVPAVPVRVLRIELTPALHDKLRRAQALLAHAVPSGEPAAILDRALDALIARVEVRRFGAAQRPRTAASARPTAPRTIPARVRRAVAARDDGRCTFVGADGHRCTTRHRLEFDHVRPLARGGQARVDGMRLLCRAHNQYEAERVFGRQFMQRRREERVQERAQKAQESGGPNLPRGKSAMGEADHQLKPAGSGGAGGS